MEHFFRVYRASSLHSGGWENSRKLCKPETTSRVCITISTLLVLRRGYINTEKVLYCLNPCHSLCFDHFRSRFVCGPGIICGPGLFAVLGSFPVRVCLRSWDHLRTLVVLDYIGPKIRHHSSLRVKTCYILRMRNRYFSA